METKEANPCPGCERLQEQLRQTQARLDTLQAEVVRLAEQLAKAKKDSSSSSKPPSSDIVKPKPAADQNGNKRSIGGQPGHPKHEHLLFPPEQVTRFEVHPLHGCPCCGGNLSPNADLARVVQQIDLPIDQPPLVIEQHTSPEYWCVNCQRSYWAAMPSVIEKGGLVGPRLTTLIAYLKGPCHASYSTIRKFLRDVVRVTISRGQLAKIISKVSQALDQPYQELLEHLPGCARLNVDETSHPENGDRLWTWCFRASLFTLFKIDPTRSGDVLIAVLGQEFDGVLGCDYYSAYRRYMREFGVTLQFCLAHLIRDVKFLTTLPDARDKAYGERLREALRHLFGVIHRREQLAVAEFHKQLEAARDVVLCVGTQDVPPTRASGNLALRLTKHGESYFRFVTTPAVEPTNNLAEQAIRFVVLDRLVTQGTRSEVGRRWCERIWTVIASCVQQGRSVFAYLHEAVTAYFHAGVAPSLLPQEG
jgi:transposase